MLMRFKKIITAVLAGCIAVGSVLPAAADSNNDDEERKRENYHRKGIWGYTVLDDGTAAVSDYFGKSHDLIVPEKIDGYTVTVIGGGWYPSDNGEPVLYGNVHGLTYSDNGSVEQSSVYSPFTENKSIETVILPDTVTAVGAISFQNCTSLRKVELNEGVEIIGNNCFDGCTQLSEISLPDTVKFVDQQAFYNCGAITSIELPNADYQTAAFERCTGITDITLPDGMKSLPPYMFSECSSLSTVTIPNSVTEIGDSAFNKCTSLENIQFPDSLKTIYNNAFSGCTALSQVTADEQLETVGSRAFADCTSLKELYLGDKVKKIGENAFGKTESGEPIEEFVLVCPDFSIVKEYADTNKIPMKLLAPSSSADEQAKQNYGIPEGIDPEILFYVIIGVLVLSAISVLIILVLIIKNKKTPPDPFDEG